MRVAAAIDLIVLRVRRLPEHDTAEVRWVLALKVRDELSCLGRGEVEVPIIACRSRCSWEANEDFCCLAGGVPKDPGDPRIV